MNDIVAIYYNLSNLFCSYLLQIYLDLNHAMKLNCTASNQPNEFKIKMSKADSLYKKLKDTDRLDQFCQSSGTTPDNLRQIIYHGGAISRKLATKLAQTSREMLGDRNRLKPTDFLFPNGDV